MSRRILVSVSENKVPKQDGAYVFCICDDCQREVVKLDKDRTMKWVLEMLRLCASHKKHWGAAGMPGPQINSHGCDIRCQCSNCSPHRYKSLLRHSRVKG